MRVCARFGDKSQEEYFLLFVLRSLSAFDSISGDTTALVLPASDMRVGFWVCGVRGGPKRYYIRVVKGNM